MWTSKVPVRYLTYKNIVQLGFLIPLVASFSNLLMGGTAKGPLCFCSSSSPLLRFPALTFPLTTLLSSQKHPCNYLLSSQKDPFGGFVATHL